MDKQSEVDKWSKLKMHSEFESESEVDWPLISGQGMLSEICISVWVNVLCRVMELIIKLECGMLMGNETTVSASLLAD